MASTLIHQRPMGLDIHHTPSIQAPPLRLSPPSDDRPSLPSLGLSISRPNSRLSTTSTRSLSSSYYEAAARQSVQLPGLSALASIATSTPPPERQLSIPPAQHGHPNFLNYTPTPPGAPGGIGSAPPACQNCSTSTTPLWRRDENGSVLCNACGLFLKLHGRPRPISLKTDVIKSRNRVKATGRGAKRNSDGTSPQDQPRVQSVSLAASHPGLAQMNPEQRPQIMVPQSASTESSTNSPLSRSGTPGLGGHNIAPQHMFDQVIQIPGADAYGPSPSIPQFTFRANSPGAASTSSLTATGISHGAVPNGHFELSQDVTAIKTRVSELEVINDLFRGRVNELEALVEATKQQAEYERQEKELALAQLADAKRRIEELESAGGQHRAKRARTGMEDFVHDDASGSDS